MLKKYFYFLFITILFLFKLNTSFAISPEDIFSDIKSDYKYYTELKTLLEEWIIKNENSNFEPKKLVTKKEFILELSLINSKWNYQKYVLPKNENESISILDTINIVTEVEKIKSDHIYLDTDFNWITFKEYRLFDPENWKIPIRYMNKEDLLRISYIVFMLNKEIFLVNNLNSTSDLNKDCSLDIDKDWANNCLDICPYIKWNQINNWCPILEKFCNSDCSCYSWYTCSNNNKNTCSKLWVCLPDKTLPENKCLYKNTNALLYWSLICDYVKCGSLLNFNSVLRKCDSIFSSINSPDRSVIYSSWSSFEIE